MPEGFGIPDSVAQYVAAAETGPARRAESWLAARDIEFLQVKTLSPRDPDPGYAATRSLYLGSGFRPLEELPELWGPDQPALQMIKTVPSAAAPVRFDP